jgi:hypothetical protein
LLPWSPSFTGAAGRMGAAGVADCAVVGVVCVDSDLFAVPLPPLEKTPPSARPTKRNTTASPSATSTRGLRSCADRTDRRLPLSGSGASQSSSRIAARSRVCASGSTWTGARLGCHGGTGSSNQLSRSREVCPPRAFMGLVCPQSIERVDPSTTRPAAAARSIPALLRILSRRISVHSSTRRSRPGRASRRSRLRQG